MLTWWAGPPMFMRAITRSTRVAPAGAPGSERRGTDAGSVVEGPRGPGARSRFAPHRLVRGSLPRGTRREGQERAAQPLGRAVRRPTGPADHARGSARRRTDRTAAYARAAC